MKKLLFLLFILIFLTSCIKESVPSQEEGFSFSYDEVIFNPESLFSFSNKIKEYDVPADYDYKISEEEFKKFTKENPFFANFDEYKLKVLLDKGFLPFSNENFKKTSNFIDAYSTILNNGKNIYYSSDTIGLIYANLFKKIESFVERKYNILILKKLLLALMHQSLKEYEQNSGLLKEAAWRNTAFLCIALRLIDNNSPTPFIVSGIVRKELNLINVAEGELASPLLSLDVESKLNIEKDLCFDYSIFRPFKKKKSKIDRFEMSYLWLSNFKFPLQKDINFLQAVLFTQCLKDISVSVNMRDRRGDELWGILYGFYNFFEGKENTPNFFTISSFLNSNNTLFKRFINTQNEKDLKVLKDKFLNGERDKFLTFLPERNRAHFSIMHSILFPETGPDVKDKKFKKLMLNIGKCRCKEKIRIKNKRCKELTQKDFENIFCIAKCLRFKIENIFDIFKLFPDGEDFLFLYGFEKTKNSFCKYNVQINRLKRKIQNGKYLDMDGHFIRVGFLMYYDYEKIGKLFCLPDKSKYEICGLNILNFKRKKGIGHFFSGNMNSNVDYFLDPLPSFYGYISDLLDFIRKKLLMEGLSDLEFDEYLLQYVNIASELEKISINEIKNGSASDIDKVFLKNLFKRINFIEEKSSERWNLYYNVLNISFPLEKVYGVNESINRRFIGCSSELMYSVILRKYKDGTIHYFISPISIPFELVSTRNGSFNNEELNDILIRGSYIKIKGLEWIYDNLLH